MSIEIEARVHAFELLLTQLISEYLRGVPDSRQQAAYAREQLARAAAQMPLPSRSLDEEAKLRVRIEEEVARVLDAALQRTVTIPLYTRPRDPEKDAPG